MNHRKKEELNEPQKKGRAQLISQDGITVLKKEVRPLNKIPEQFYPFLNVPKAVITSNHTPSQKELAVATASVLENKVPGKCGIPAGVEV